MFNYKEVRRLEGELAEANAKLDQYVNLLNTLFNRNLTVDGVAIPVGFTQYYETRRDLLRGVLAFSSVLKNQKPAEDGKKEKK